MTVKEWLAKAKDRLQQQGIESAKLDGELILAHTLRKSRTYLHAHDDEKIPPQRLEVADARLVLRIDRTPVAYIVGHKEFYGRLFKVTPATLIPRPESEDIITLLKDWSFHYNIDNIVDVGTGTGCLGITAKLELPQANVTLLDVSRHALRVAEANAKHLLADVQIEQSNLLSDFHDQTNVIIANLPYVDRDWHVSPETKHEPSLALYADHDGLALIYTLLDQASGSLSADGTLLIEADNRQHHAIINYAATKRLRHIKTQGLIVQLTNA